MVERADRYAEQSLRQEMGITEQEIARRKAYLEFGAEDARLLETMGQIAERYADSVIEDFYGHLLSFEEARPFFTDPKVLQYVKRKQKEYFLRLTQGNYDLEYIEDRIKVGEVHERIALPTKLYLGMYNFYLQAVASRLLEAFPDQPEQVLRLFLALSKLVFLDVGLAIDTYIHKRERTIRQQQEAIRELSTPVLQLREGQLILPIIGVLDSLRARQLTEQLLRAIRINRAKVVVMDITGVPIVDSKVANHIVQTVQAARLMGATVIVTGLSPEIAQTLVTLGLDLSMMNTVGDLQGGIEEADRQLGYRVVRTGGVGARDEQE